MNPITLKDAADRVATAELAVLRAQQTARGLAEAIAARKAEFAHVIAFDQTLTNDAKRKSGMEELERTDCEYLELQTQHQAAKDAAVEAQIEADLQGRLWQVARIEAEGTVAQTRRLGALEY